MNKNAKFELLSSQLLIQRLQQHKAWISHIHRKKNLFGNKVHQSARHTSDGLILCLKIWYDINTMFEKYCDINTISIFMQLLQMFLNLIHSLFIDHSSCICIVRCRTQQPAINYQITETWIDLHVGKYQYCDESKFLILIRMIQYIDIERIYRYFLYIDQSLWQTTWIYTAINKMLMYW